MPSETAIAVRYPATNLLVALGMAGLLYFGWSWADFSGPFRLFVDVQLHLFEGYSELAAALASAIAIVGAVWLAAVSLRWAYPNLSESAADAAVAVVFVSASVVALWQVWHLWNEALHMPRLRDPVQVVNLGLGGKAAIPVGHVRVIGTPDRSRQVLIYFASGRRSGSSYWEAWVPLASQNREAADTLVRIVATARDSDRSATMKAVADNPEGMLLFDSVDTRTIYELRRDGLAIAEHPFALYLDEDVRFDKFIDASLLLFVVLLFWGMAAFGKLKDRRGSIMPAVLPAPSSSEIARPASTTTVDVSSSPGPQPSLTVEGLMTRVGTGAAIASMVAGGLLWEGFGFPVTETELLAYVGAGIALGVSLLLIRLGERRGAVAREVPLAPPVSMTNTSTPQPRTALLYVLRDEPGFSSTSYIRVVVDGLRVADLRSNRYTVIAVRPGVHMLAVNTRFSLTNDTVARFEVAAGAVVAYRLRIPPFGQMRLERTLDIREVHAAVERLTFVESAQPTSTVT